MSEKPETKGRKVPLETVMKVERSVIQKPETAAHRPPGTQREVVILLKDPLGNYSERTGASFG